MDFLGDRNIDFALAGEHAGFPLRPVTGYLILMGNVSRWLDQLQVFEQGQHEPGVIDAFSDKGAAKDFSGKRLVLRDAAQAKLDSSQRHDFSGIASRAFVAHDGDEQVLTLRVGQDAVGDVIGGALTRFPGAGKLQGNIGEGLGHGVFHEWLAQTATAPFAMNGAVDRQLRLGGDGGFNVAKRLLVWPSALDANLEIHFNAAGQGAGRVLA